MNGTRGTLAYQPALDGVRAVAVSLVLLFHLGLGWMPAGYLGVSVFFTLSGFLITSLLLDEFGRDGTVSFRRFYARRARRLLPASMACLTAIVVARWTGEFAHVPGFRADLLGAVLQVFNWVQLAGGSSYSALFGRAPAFTSPLEHYWSLAIEEQFYLLWPVSSVAICRWRARSGRSVVRPVLALTVLFAVIAPLIGWRFGPDAAYWATPARLGELLVGACAAAWLPRLGLRPGARWLAPAALAVVVVCSATFPSGAGPAFAGWLAPFALVSVALVVGLQVPGPMRSVLSVRPVAWLGKVSYGLYLVHWPVFVLMRQHGWDLTEWLGAVLAVAITLAITISSYWLLERPARQATWSPGRTGAVALATSMAVLVGVLAVPVSRGFLEPNRKVLAAASIDTGAPVVALATIPPTTVPVTTAPTTTTAVTTTTIGEVVLPLPAVPNRPVRVLVVGDSTAFYVGQGMAAWAVQHPQHAQVDLLWCQGCGFILDGTITSFDASAFVQNSNSVVLKQLPQKVSSLHPDVVLLMVTVDDIADRSWAMAEGVLTPHDRRYRDRMRTDYQALTDSLLGMGVPNVVWTVPPVPHTRFATADLGEADRYEVQHDVIREVVTETVRPPGATVVACDLDGWLRQAGHDRDDSWRPDGTHLTEVSAGKVVDRWLGPWLVATALGAGQGS